MLKKPFLESFSDHSYSLTAREEKSNLAGKIMITTIIIASNNNKEMQSIELVSKLDKNTYYSLYYFKLRCCIAFSTLIKVTRIKRNKKLYIVYIYKYILRIFILHSLLLLARFTCSPIIIIIIILIQIQGYPQKA